MENSGIPGFSGKCAVFCPESRNNGNGQELDTLLDYARNCANFEVSHDAILLESKIGHFYRIYQHLSELSIRGSS